MSVTFEKKQSRVANIPKSIENSSLFFATIFLFFSIIAFPVAMCIGFNHIQYFFCCCCKRLKQKFFFSSLIFKVKRIEKKSWYYQLGKLVLINQPLWNLYMITGIVFQSLFLIRSVNGSMQNIINCFSNSFFVEIVN